jgi:hypothetical protein
VKKIKFHCPHCSALLRVPTHLAGVSGPCPKCGKKVTSGIGFAGFYLCLDRAAAELDWKPRFSNAETLIAAQGRSVWSKIGTATQLTPCSCSSLSIP